MNIFGRRVLDKQGEIVNSRYWRTNILVDEPNIRIVAWAYNNDFGWRCLTGRLATAPIRIATSIEDAQMKCDQEIKRLYPDAILCETEEMENKYKLLI